MANKDIENFKKYLSQITPGLEEKLKDTIGLCCQKVRSDIQTSMAQTPRNTSVTYYTNNKTKGHHPSLPGNPPAPDTGNLRNSIRYEVNGSGKSVYGIVGTTQKDPPYGAYLEYGTSRMAPRPWLKPAMNKNADWIRNMIKKAVGQQLEGAKK